MRRALTAAGLKAALPPAAVLTRLSLPLAVALAGTLIAAAIVLATVVLAARAPSYRLVSGRGGFWWVNENTGEVRYCTGGVLSGQPLCGPVWRLNQQLPTADEILGVAPK